MRRSCERRAAEVGGGGARAPGPDAVLFATSNGNKFAEASGILAGLGIRAGLLRCEPEEIQSDSLVKIAARKAEWAAASAGAGGAHVIVEDDGLFVDELRGFPGPYSAYVHGTVGAAALRRILPRGAPGGASFVSAVAYAGPVLRALRRGRTEREGRLRADAGGGGGPAVFTGSVRGRIAARPRGAGWGYDPVFVPAAAGGGGAGGRTFAQMGADEKSAVSHRRAALAGFAAWFAANSAPARRRRGRR